MLPCKSMSRRFPLKSSLLLPMSTMGATPETLSPCQRPSSSSHPHSPCVQRCTQHYFNPRHGTSFSLGTLSIWHRQASSTYEPLRPLLFGCRRTTNPASGISTTAKAKLIRLFADSAPRTANCLQPSGFPEVLVGFSLKHKLMCSFASTRSLSLPQKVDGIPLHAVPLLGTTCPRPLLARSVHPLQLRPPQDQAALLQVLPIEAPSHPTTLLVATTKSPLLNISCPPRRWLCRNSIWLLLRDYSHLFLL